MDLPVSSGNKEGLSARIEGVERVEAADEGLGRTRGMESESEVECIQSQTWRDSSWEARQTPTPGDVFPFNSCLDHALFHNLGVFVIKLPHHLPHHKTRPLEATTRLVPSLITRHSSSIMSFQSNPSTAEQNTTGLCAVIF
jgi:hypothetical protein